LLQQKPLLLELQSVFQGSLENVAYNPPAAGLGNRPGRELIRGRVDVIDLDSRKALLENRENFLSVDLSQSSVKIKGSTLLERLLVDFVQTLARSRRREAEKQKT
jgi:hypothetical protein